MEFEKPMLHYISKHFLLIDYEKVKKKHGIWWLVFLVLAVSTVRGIAGMVLRNENFWYGFLYPFILFAIVSIIILPLFIFKDKHPKIVEIYSLILIALFALVFIGIALLIIYGIINTVFNL